MLLLGDFSVIRPEPGLLFWTVAIFLFFWFIMGRLAFKPIIHALKQREQDIQDALDQAKKAREEMAALQAEHEKLLAQAREERSQILKEAKEAKEHILAEARERAHAEYRRRVESALRDIENQKMAALVELKNMAGQMAVEIAEKILQRELSNKVEQEAYARQLAEQMRLN
ncbi:MAG: F0F1 ATP synthase subunit B [Saprospiraceae bacterium]|nr:F0F1 ATP synthase subunit B [Saprospiraceae bacterium]MDW8484912.1 F0F1 ATP synthase subunit B [Saprospiraceae bacterium]